MRRDAATYRYCCDEIAVRGSPRALTVLPAFGTKTLKPVPAGTDSKKYVATSSFATHLAGCSQLVPRAIHSQ